MQPIARISLPTHHPAVSKLKNGGMVKIHAKKAESEMMNPTGYKDGGKVGKQPPPMSTDFHVTNIEPMEGSPAEEAKETPAQERAEQKARKKGPMDYLKSKQK